MPALVAQKMTKVRKGWSGEGSKGRVGTARESTCLIVSGMDAMRASTRPTPLPSQRPLLTLLGVLFGLTRGSGGMAGLLTE